MELRYDRDAAARRVLISPDRIDDFVRDNDGFIIRCASKVCGRFITRSDDEYEVALVAFYEATRSYNPEAGSFSGFAALVIRRRLLDHFERVRRHSAEIPIGSAMTWEEDDAPAQSSVITEVQRTIARRSEERESTAADEIQALGQELAAYGFSFYDLESASPRAAKTKAGCAEAVRWLIKSPDRIESMRRQRALPTRALCDECGLSRKLLDRHRRYIIAAAEILYGDYPHLAEYLSFIKRGMNV